jgi:hypothetical protein
MVNNEVADAADRLIDAVRQHAALMADPEVAEEVAVAAIDTLREAALRYQDTVEIVTGWPEILAELADDDDEFNGDDIEDLDDLDDDLDDDEDLDGAAEGELADDGPILIAIRARYDYVVSDPDALIRAGQAARLRALGGDSEEPAEGGEDYDESANEPVTHVGEAIYELFHAGGVPFGALDVPELEPGSGFVTVHRVQVPLDPEEVAGPGADLEDLFLADEDEEEVYTLGEPRYGSREEAEAAARRHAEIDPATSRAVGAVTAGGSTVNGHTVNGHSANGHGPHPA